MQIKRIHHGRFLLSLLILVIPQLGFAHSEIRNASEVARTYKAMYRQSTTDHSSMTNHAMSLGFGVGLVKRDSEEIITYISRESSANDVDLKIGDAIVRINGQPIVPSRNPLAGILFDDLDSVNVSIRRGDGDTMDVVLFRTRLRSQASSCAMVDHQEAYLKLSAFDEYAGDSLEAILDSLAVGSTGYTYDADTAASRFAEACAHVRPMVADRYLSTEEEAHAEYTNAIRQYVSDKYGWQLSSIILDVRGASIENSRPVLRAIRLFCRDHGVTLIREI